MRSDRTIRTLAALACTTLALALGSTGAGAQLAHASASNLALSDNTTATARAFGAISVNPAGLGMPGSGFSLALAPIQGRAGIGPVTLSDLSDFQGIRVPALVAEEWLTAIEAAGGHSGSTGADVSELALTIGSFGLQLSTTASASFTIPSGVAQAILFGNAGRTGEAADLDLTGLGVDAWAATTGAVSYAFPVGPAMFGATGKYTVGHGLAVARAPSGSFSSDALVMSLASPVLRLCDDGLLGQCTESLGNNGSGFGMDVGFMMDLPMVRVGASVINVFNTFAWAPATLSYRPGSTL